MRLCDDRYRTSLRVLCVLGCAAGVALAEDGPAPETPARDVHVKLSTNETSAMVDGVAAYVNGDAITIGDVMGSARTYLREPQWSAGRSREEALRAAYAEALGQLVNQRLILQAYADGETRLPEWVIEKRMAELLDTRFGGDRAALLRELADQRLTTDDWRKRVHDQMVVGAMRQSQVEANVQIRPAQIRARYEENPDAYSQTAATHVGLIFVKQRVGETDDALAVRIQAVQDRLATNEAFSVVARALSDDASAAKGGDWGWIVPADVLRDELVQALAAVPTGSNSPLVTTPVGVYVLRKIGERAAGRRSLEEVRSEVERDLFAAESQRLYLSWVMRLRSRAHIRTFDVF